MSTHWASVYIGTPWAAGEQGPEAFDCWGFTRCVQRSRFGRELPLVAVDVANVRAVARQLEGHEERSRWARVERPEEGDCVLMAHARYATHIGVWINADGGGVLHCVRHKGVVFSNLRALAVSGFGRVEYYRWAG